MSWGPRFRGNVIHRTAQENRATADCCCQLSRGRSASIRVAGCEAFQTRKPHHCAALAALVIVAVLVSSWSGKRVVPRSLRRESGCGLETAL
jgi:hypothetical protein